MEFKLGFKRSILSAACGCQFLALNTFACGQSAPAHGERQLKFSEYQIVSQLMFDIGGEDYIIRMREQLGEDPAPARRHFSESMQITADEEQAMRAVCLDALNQLAAIDRQMDAMRPKVPS